MIQSTLYAKHVMLSHISKKESYTMPICLNCNIEFKKHSDSAANKYCNFDCYNKCKKGPSIFWDTATEDQKLKRLKYYFEKKVIRKEGCWKWIGSVNRGGYGLISVKGINRVASRISWIIHNGEIPSGLFVLHSCDNPICTNPEHLFLGTTKDNAMDRKLKGRNGDQCGENNGSVLLTKQQVLEIRELCEKGISYNDIVEKYKITKPTISNIKYRIIWRHI